MPAFSRNKHEPSFSFRPMKPKVPLLLAFVWATAAHAGQLNETFDAPDRHAFTQGIVRSGLGVLDRGTGPDKSNALKVYYNGYSQGSRRVLASERLPHPSSSAELEFDVKFCKGFDFVKGGKLHGLGPLKPITGGNKVTDTGWSARLMFTQGGGLMTYVYQQNMKGKYGDVKKADNFTFDTDVYYRIRMAVRLNSSPEKADGEVIVYVDGKKLITHDKIRFRNSLSAESEISTFLFNTFHGGHTKAWAPLENDGSYATECAYFDNFVVN